MKEERSFGWREPAALAAVALLARWLVLAATASGPVFLKYVAMARELAAAGYRPSEVWTSSPLYTYWIAGWLAVLGPNPQLLRLVETALGALAPALLWLVARRLFGLWEGRIAGLALALSPAAWLLDQDLLGVSLVNVLNLAALAAVLSARRRPALFVLGGLAAGASAAVRPNALLAVPLTAAWIVWGTEAPLARRLGRAALFCLAAALPVLPFTLQNYRISGELIPVTASSGAIFYSSQNYAASGLGYSAPPLLSEWEGEGMRGGDPTSPVEHEIFAEIASRSAGRPLSPTEVSDFWSDLGWQAIGRAPGQALTRTARKLFYLVHRYESADVASTILAARRIPLLGLLGMAAAAPAGLIGIALALRRRRRAMLAALWAVPYVVTALALYVTARLRFPLVPLLLPYAAFAAVQAARLAAARRYGPLAAALAVWLALTAACLPADKVIRRDRDIEKSVFVLEMEGTALQATGRIDAARRAFERAVALDPDGAARARAGLAAILRLQGDMEGAAGHAAALGGRPALSIEELERRAAADPADHESRAALGVLLFGRGDRAAARRRLEEARALQPEDPAVRYNLAVLLASGSTPLAGPAIDELEAALARGLALTPRAADAYLRLGRLHLRRGEPEAGREALLTALRIQPNLAPALDALRALEETEP